MRSVLLAACLVIALHHPATADTAGTALVPEGLEQLGYFDFKKAYDVYGQALERTEEGSDTWLEALYGRAISAQHIAPPSPALIDEARELFLRLAEEYPQSRFAPRAALNLGRLAELSDYYQDVVDLQAAKEWYERVIRDWPDQAIIHEAALRRAAADIQTYEHERVTEGVAYLEGWLAQHPDHDLDAPMWVYLAETYFYPLEDYAAALRCYRAADARGLVRKGKRGEVYWRAAQIAERFVDDRDAAVEYYTKIIDLVPTSGKAYEAQRALERLGAPVPEFQLDILLRAERPLKPEEVDAHE